MFNYIYCKFDGSHFEKCQKTQKMKKFNIKNFKKLRDI